MHLRPKCYTFSSHLIFVTLKMETMETLKMYLFYLCIHFIYLFVHLCMYAFILFYFFFSGGSWYKAGWLYLGNVPELSQQTKSQTRAGAYLCGAVSEQSPTAMTQIQWPQKCIWTLNQLYVSKTSLYNGVYFKEI